MSSYTNSVIHKAAGSLVTGRSQKTLAGTPPDIVPPLMVSGLER